MRTLLRLLGVAGGATRPTAGRATGTRTLHRTGTLHGACSLARSTAGLRRSGRRLGDFGTDLRASNRGPH